MNFYLLKNVLIQETVSLEKTQGKKPGSLEVLAYLVFLLDIAR